MKEILELLLKWWALFFCGILLFCIVVYAAMRGCYALKLLAKKVWKACPAIIAITIFSVIYGGSKSVGNRFSSDEGLKIVSAEINIATNEVDDTTLTVVWTGPDTNQVVYVREKTTEYWSLITDANPNWSFTTRSYENGTNTAVWTISHGVAASNITAYAMFHLGENDLPPVEIVDMEGIEVLSYGATSHSVTMEYGINPDALGNILNYAVIDMAGNDNSWVEMYRAVVMPGDTEALTNSVQFQGFWVGRTTKWRARLEVVKP